MARIEGTGETPKRRWRLPQLHVNLSPALVMVVLSPVVLNAPDDFLRAVAVAVVIGAAHLAGVREGRAEMAREVLRDLRPNER